MPKFHSSAYIATAKVLNKCTKDYAEAPTDRVAVLVVERVARDMAIVFEADNPRFNRDRFLKACGAQ